MGTRPYGDDVVRPVNATDSITALARQPYFQEVTFAKTGYTDHRGTRVAVYEANRTELRSRYRRTGSSGEITTATAELWMSQTGILRYARYHLESAGVGGNTPDERRFEIEYFDIGETTVKQPSWVGQAEEKNR